MATSLESKLTTILQEKNEKIIPENIKKGITIFDVEGTLDGGTSDSGVKLFETIEEMNNSTENKEGDLAVVYRSEIKNLTNSTAFQKVTFPELVILPEAVTDYIQPYIMATNDDGYVMCDLWMDGSSFNLQYYNETSQTNIIVDYTSSDGITYVRTTLTGTNESVNGNTVDFETPLVFAYGWNDVIGYFFQTGGIVFDGMYEYMTTPSEDGYLRLIDNIEAVVKTPTIKKPDYMSNFVNVLIIIKSIELCDTKLHDLDVYELKDYYIIYNDETNSGSNGMSVDTILKANDKTVLYGQRYNSINSTSLSNVGVFIEKYENKELVDSVNYTNNELINMGIYLNEINSGWKNYIYEFDILPNDVLKTSGLIIGGYHNSSSFKFGSNSTGYTGKVIYDGDLSTLPLTTFSTTTVNTYSNAINYHSYKNAPSQLDATADFVFSKTFYGKNGVEIGTLGPIANSKESLKNSIMVYSGLQKITVEDEISLYEAVETSTIEYVPDLDILKSKNIGFLFNYCTQLKRCGTINAPEATDTSVAFSSCESLITAPELIFPKTTTVRHLFSGCGELINVPVYNFPLVTNAQVMFSGDLKLSNDSLNNIMQTCINFTEFTKLGVNLTLKYIGLTAEQATICTGLSNYTAFTAAGWTTGY